MKCGICGKENPEEAVKCKQCNALLRRVNTPPAVPVAAAAEAKRPAGVLIAAGGVALVAVAIVYFAFLRGPAPQPAAAAAPKAAIVPVEQELAAEIQKMEKAHQQSLEELELGTLYDPATFVTREAILQTSYAVKEADERDARAERQWQVWRAGIAQKVAKSSKPAEEKAAFAKRLEGALAGSEAAQKRARAARKQWAHATLDLYDYAASNTEHIDAKGGEVKFRHPEVAAGFRSRLARAQKLNQEGARLSAQAVDTRRAKLKEAGVESPQ